MDTTINIWTAYGSLMIFLIEMLKVLRQVSVKWYEEGEKNSNFFLNLEKRLCYTK